MAITKIHPIKSTLHFAIHYILDENKTDKHTLISSHMCFPTTAHLQFIQTRNEHKVAGTVLARHLIQSFLPGEVDQETAHKIGLELCQSILKNEYEYVLTTHIDRGHIHNHIIFNNVNFQTGKCYQSNKRTYHHIRKASDRLCKKYKLSIIDEDYQTYRKKYKTRGKTHYEWEVRQKGKGWKPYLQFLIDLNISRSNSWEEFLERMKKAKCSIKHGKHIAFKHASANRFTRAKSIGPDYSEDQLRKRIANKPPQALLSTQSLDSNKGLAFWSKKQNLKAMARGIVELRNLGIQTKEDLEKALQVQADKQLDLQEKIKNTDRKIDLLGNRMENIHTVQRYEKVYQFYKNDPGNKLFKQEYAHELQAYRQAKIALPSQSKSLTARELLKELDDLQNKKNTLMTEYSQIKSDFDKLYQHKKNFDTYFEQEQGKIL